MYAQYQTRTNTHSGWHMLQDDTCAPRPCTLSACVASTMVSFVIFRLMSSAASPRRPSSISTSASARGFSVTVSILSLLQCMHVERSSVASSGTSRGE
eukprot:5951643-Pleurochrysis_carterae.AAC.1